MYKKFKNTAVRLAFLFIGLLFFSFSLQVKNDSEKNPGELRTLKNNAFKVGEKLTFDVKYGFVTAGIASFHIPRIRKMSGRDVYHVTF